MAIILSAIAVSLAEARTRRGDLLLAEGNKAEHRQYWDQALEFYQRALAEDPSDSAYQLAEKRLRFRLAQFLVEQGQKHRETGDLARARAGFERALAIDPSSIVAGESLKAVIEIIERIAKAAAAGGEVPAGERSLTSAEAAARKEQARISQLAPPSELKPMSRQPISIRMANQPPRILFDTVAKLAGISVVFDPEYRNDANSQRSYSLDLSNATIEEALDSVAAMTKAFWKPLSPNAIFISTDSQPKRRDYEETAVKVFYLRHLTTPQQLTEIATNIRLLSDMRRVVTCSTVDAILVRGTPDQILLAAKLINDLDKPASEVVVDVLVLEANRNRTRELAATLADSSGAAGLNTGIAFSPRNPVTVGGSDGSSDSTTAGSSSQQWLSLGRIGHLSSNDFAVSLPGALLQAVTSDSSTRILQSPQIRATSGQKASIRIGKKEPVATGGVQMAAGQAAGYSSLYSQFQFVDVGVNVDVTPIVHGDGDVTLKITVDISNVSSRVEIGGISQPVIGQRKVEHEIRVKQGEVSLLGGLLQEQETKTKSGVPGLAGIPGLGRLFSSDSQGRDRSELLIALVPHIVRTPGVTGVNLETVAAGPEQNLKLRKKPADDGKP